MSRWRWWILGTFVVLLSVVFMARGMLRDAWETWSAPPLPPAQSFHPKEPAPTVDAPSDITTFEGGNSTSEHFVLQTNPQPKVPVIKDPLAFDGPLPDKVNLAVPFTSQAPSGNWDMPYQEACEETSILMVDAFYRGESGRIAPDVADARIKSIVELEKQVLGFYEDTNANQTAKVIQAAYNDTVIVRPWNSIEDLKKPLALGYPVIIPAAGKMLGNPNFRNGGPLYHMLVVRGYTPSFIITNDPGTRKGEGYTYSYETLMKAAHDWNGGNVTTGARMMLVILPK